MLPGERQERRAALPVASGGSQPGAAASALSTAEPAEATAARETPETPETPEIPEAVRAAARAAPGHWIGVVDPEWTEEGPPPDWAVLGEWRSDASGGLEDFRPNPAYRPSARVLGWPEPTDPVDAAAQRAATGYGSVQEALAVLADANVTVLRAPDGGPLTAAGRDGAPVVPLFTSPWHRTMTGELLHEPVSVGELARSLRGSGTLLLVNPGAAAPLLVPADGLPVRGRGAADDQPPATPAGGAGGTGPGGTSGAEGRTGGPPMAASSAGRRSTSDEPRSHTTGKSP
ncbi:type VII secretion system-associated protein [Streptomyces spongiicola]|uniref:type VII secretion system-associated protein n=1 Tax=Streptomyces spongiicola TaxID=1690221 RepID=UPI003F4CCB84